MANYNPPTEDITGFNTSLFNQPEDTLSQAEADKLYLSKTKNDISTASSTTFNGGVNVGGSLNLKSGVKTTDLTQTSDGVFTIGNRNPSGSISILAQTAGGANQGITLSSTALTMNNFIPLNTRIIRSTDTSSTHSVFDDMIASGSLTIGGTASTNSIRGNTTFPQNVSIQGTLDIVSGTNTNKLSITGGNATYTMNAGATTATTHLFNTYTNANVPKGSFQIGSTNVAVLDSLLFTCRQIRSSATSSNAHEIFSNILSAAKITMGGTASTNEIRGDTTFPQNVTIGIDGVANNLSLKGEQRFYDTATPYTSYAKISTSGINVNYESPNVTSSFHIFKVYSGGVLSNALEIQNYQIVTKLQLSITDKIEFNPTAYAFPHGGASGYKYLGHNFQNTGTAFTTLISAAPKTILTSAVTIPIGIWRVDFSVINQVTTAGTITQAQSFVSRTVDGNVGTAINATGSVVRSHVSEVYTAGDIQEITSSFTLNQSTAGLIYLNIVRSFGGGAYSFTGEMSYTRIG